MPIIPGELWVPSSGSFTVTTHTTSGLTTTQGSTLVLTVMCRDNTSTVPVVSDPAGNTWVLAGTYRDPGQSVVQHLFYAVNAAPITSVAHTMYAADGVTAPTATHSSILREFKGAGGFTVAASLGTPSTAAGGPANGATVTTVQPGSLVVDAVTAGGANRVLTPGAGWVTDRLVSMAQMYHWFTWHVAEVPGPVTPLWTLTSGAASSFGHVTAVFAPATDPVPDPEPVPSGPVWARIYDGTVWKPLAHPTITT